MHVTLTKTHFRSKFTFSWYMVAGIAYSRALLLKVKSSGSRANQYRMICQTIRRQTITQKMLPQEHLKSPDPIQIAVPRLRVGQLEPQPQPEQTEVQ